MSGIASWYANALKKRPRLSREEEQTLARRAQNGDQAAKDELVLRNMGLVFKNAHSRKYQGKGVDLDDLVSEGTIGLMRAVNKFDPDRGIFFATYATWDIRDAMDKAITSQSKTIRIPDYAYKLARKAVAIAGESKARGKKITLKEAIKGLDIRHDCQVIEDAVNAINGVSELTIKENGDLSHDTESKEESVLDAIERDSIAQYLAEVIDSLPERERIAIEVRCGTKSGIEGSFAQVGKALGGKTPQWAQRIFKKALASVSAKIEEDRAL